MCKYYGIRVKYQLMMIRTSHVYAELTTCAGHHEKKPILNNYLQNDFFNIWYYPTKLQCLC
jgi:hypothetical protein